MRGLAGSGLTGHSEWSIPLPSAVTGLEVGNRLKHRQEPFFTPSNSDNDVDYNLGLVSVSILGRQQRQMWVSLNGK